MNRQIASQHSEIARAPFDAGGILQRKCDCGNHTVAGGECSSCSNEREGTLRRAAINRGAANSPGGSVPPIVNEVLNTPGQPLDANTRAFFEPRFKHDFSRVRIHADAGAATSASAVAAEAYTAGAHVVFGAHAYQPSTASGRQLIAHELTHVVQQGEVPIPSHLHLDTDVSPGESQAENVSRQLMTAETTSTQNTGPTSLMGNVEAGGKIMRSRVPSGPGLTDALPAADPGFSQARIGLARTVSRAWAGLNAPQQSRVRARTAGLGITWATEDDLRTRLESATRAQLVDFAQAIRTVAPSAELGSPFLIDTGPRPLTADAANITTLVNNADAIFNTIINGERDSHLVQVFGAAKVAEAKTKYTHARVAMNLLHGTNHIVTDRSGYGEEAFVGGLSSSEQISVERAAIDHPTWRESIITLIHESMHAGNTDVTDLGYIWQPLFKVLDPDVKIRNAAHFEVVPRRMLGMGASRYAFPGLTFLPPGTGGTPALTPRQQAIRDASETYRSAWGAALNLHTFFVRLFRIPAEWNTLDLHAEFGAAAGAHFSDTLPFWSKVEMLTMHTRLPSINPAGAPAVRPVTLIDIALSEGLARKLAQGQDRVPLNEAAAQSLENTRANAAERTAAAASVNAERDLLIRLVLRVYLGSLTGDVARDERAVARLSQTGMVDNFSDMLAVRSPSAFP